MAEDRLLIIDLYNILTRAWHGIAPYHLPDGRGVHAVRGTLASINKGLKAFPSRHILVALDDRPTKRLKIDPSYKAQRPPTDPDLKAQRQLTVDLLRSCGWPLVSVEGWEADDVIASAAKTYKGEVMILSGDRDMLGLCSPRVKVFLPGKELLCGEKECEEIFGIRPDQLCDYKALAGDSSDGFAGVPSVGPKTAVALLQKYGTLAEVYKAENLATIKPDRLRTVLTDNRDKARVSWQLARLYANLPVQDLWMEVEDLYGPDTEAAFDYLNLQGLAKYFAVLPGSQASGYQGADLVA